jgi:alpha-ribazole phosphatase
MTRLLLIRHGETDWNAQHRYLGHTDLPLNAAGLRQAEEVAERLRAEPIAVIYSSDLRRARQTATQINVHHQVPLHLEPDLREMHFGAFEGFTYAELQARDPAAVLAWDGGEAAPGGETLTALGQRVIGCLGRILQAHPSGTVALVAHGGPLRLCLCAALGLPPEDHWRFALDPGSLSEVQLYPAGGILMRLNH